MSVTSTGYKVDLEVFEGPLDLLLHLVKKHELDILDIPIAFITEKYLEYLDLMKGLSIDIAGEYLLMAATLAHIKSRELLPPDPASLEGDDEDEDELDPREDLIRRLLEYQKYKAAGQELGNRPVVGRNVWTRGLSRNESLAEDIDVAALAPLAQVPVIKLIEALDRVLKQAKIKIAHEVNIDRLSVSDRINELADRLEREGSFSFTSCFGFLQADVEVGAAEVRHEVVVTFLALLEMGKLNLIRLSQAEDCDDLFISRAAENLRDRVTGAGVAEDEYRG